MLRRPLLAAALLLAAAPGQAQTSAKPSATLPELPAAGDFLAEVSQNARYETASGHLAETRSSNPAVRAFAAESVRDHEAARQELVQFTDGAGQKAPVAPLNTALDPRRQALMDRLTSAAPAGFDILYADQQVAEHRRSLESFRAYGEAGEVPQIRQWAGRVLPLRQRQLAAAETLRRGLTG